MTMLPQEPTIDEAAALQNILLGSNGEGCTMTIGSDDWGGAEKMTNGSAPLLATEMMGTVAEDSVTGGFGQHSLDNEMSFLQKSGREPSNEEVLEYIEKHRLQEFLSEVIMSVAQYIPADPFEFLLNHLEGLVAKFRVTHGIKMGADTKAGSKQQGIVGLDLGPPKLPLEAQGRIVRCLATVLQSEDTSQQAAQKRMEQFGSVSESGNKKMTKEGFAKLLDHVEDQWGLEPEDTKLMAARLQRWRFRNNIARGTRGLPLWPMATDDFISAWPSLLRAVRDRYVPIGGRMHRSLFIKKAEGNLKDRYTLGQSLGRGAFGEVMLVSHKETRQRRVCKRVGRQQQKLSHDQLMAEVDLLRGMDHPHIIRLFEFYETEEHLDMIMEPVFGGTLTRVVQGLWLDEASKHKGARPACLKESWVATMFSQLLGALNYAHDVVGIVHKDLKTDNVLLVGAPYMNAEELLTKQQVHAMVADFGIAEIFNSAGRPQAMENLWATEPEVAMEIGTMSAPPTSISRSRTTKLRSKQVGGTPSYMSPEMFTGSFTEKCDIWSLGVIMFNVLTGELPYRGENLLMQGNMVCNPRRHPAWDLLTQYKWSLGARWCCQQMLSKDEGMRPSASVALRDTWVTKASAEQYNVLPGKNEVESLQRQHLQSHLMKMALNCVASQLNLSQLHYLNLRFKKYDLSGDGRLSHVEMRQALEDVGVPAGTDAELIIESLDGDHSGMIEYSEFVAGCLSLAKDGIRETLRIAFEVFDLDGNGTISRSELKSVLFGGSNAIEPTTRRMAGTARLDSTAAGLSAVLPDGKTAEEVMADIDLDGSEKVEYSEFEAYLLREHARLGEEKAAKEGPPMPAMEQNFMATLEGALPGSEAQASPSGKPSAGKMAAGADRLEEAKRHSKRADSREGGSQQPQAAPPE